MHTWGVSVQNGAFLCLVQAGQHCTKRRGHGQTLGSAHSGKLCRAALNFTKCIWKSFQGVGSSTQAELLYREWGGEVKSSVWRGNLWQTLSKQCLWGLCCCRQWCSIQIPELARNEFTQAQETVGLGDAECRLMHSAEKSHLLRGGTGRGFRFKGGSVPAQSCRNTSLNRGNTGVEALVCRAQRAFTHPSPLSGRCAAHISVPTQCPCLPARSDQK